MLSPNAGLEPLALGCPQRTLRQPTHNGRLSPPTQELLECFSGSPAVAMDVRRNPWFLIVAWALLDMPLSNGESQGTNGPCEWWLRYWHSSVESGGPWLPTLVLLSSIGAIWLFVFYAIRCLCLRRNQCAQELDERGERCWQEDADQPEFRSTPLGINPALQAYAHQLACMEHELEHFLSEVRNLQSTLRKRART